MFISILTLKAYRRPLTSLRHYHINLVLPTLRSTHRRSSPRYPTQNQTSSSDLPTPLLRLCSTVLARLSAHLPAHFRIHFPIRTTHLPRFDTGTTWCVHQMVGRLETEPDIAILDPLGNMERQHDFNSYRSYPDPLTSHHAAQCEFEFVPLSSITSGARWLLWWIEYYSCDSRTSGDDTQQ